MKKLLILLAVGCSAQVGTVSQATDGSAPAVGWTRHTIFHDGVLRGADGVDALGTLILSPWEQSNKFTISDLATGSTQIVSLPSGFAPEGASFGDYDLDGAVDVSVCGDVSKQMRVYWGPSFSTFTQVNNGLQNWLVCQPADIDGQRVILSGGRKTTTTSYASIGYFTSPTPRVSGSWTYNEIGPVGLAWTLEYRDFNGVPGVFVADGGDVPGLRGTRWVEQTATGWVNHPIATLGGTLGRVKMADADATSVVDGSYYTTTGNHVFLRTTADWLTFTSVELPPPPGAGNYQSAVRGELTGDCAEDIVVTFVNADDSLSGVMLFDGTDWIDIGGPDGVKYDNALLIDVDQDGDLDVVTSEHKSNKAPAAEQLGVVWYENPL